MKIPGPKSKADTYDTFGDLRNTGLGFQTRSRAWLQVLNWFHLDENRVHWEGRKGSEKRR
jgi:hypothetical protein